MSLEGNAVAGQTLKGRINAIDILTISAYGIAVKHGFKGTEEEWLDSLNMDQDGLDEAIARYLEKNPVAMDTTLTESGKAADAKATGDAIKSLQRTSEGGLNAHANDKENPHGVTKEQVGLNKVDNTSDMEKPVSNAQYVAIAKAKDEAIGVANNAQTSADNAQTAADNAQTTADEAKASAQTLSDNALESAKAYADSKHKLVTATLTVADWSAEAPYTQTISVEGIIADDAPHVSPVYSDTLETALAEKEAWAMVSRGKPGENAITFTCFEDKPTVDIPILIEVNR